MFLNPLVLSLIKFKYHCAERESCQDNEDMSRKITTDYFHMWSHSIHALWMTLAILEKIYFSKFQTNFSHVNRRILSSYILSFIWRLQINFHFKPRSPGASQGSLILWTRQFTRFVISARLNQAFNTKSKAVFWKWTRIWRQHAGESSQRLA